MSVGFNLINLDPLNQDKILIQKRKNSQQVSNIDFEDDVPIMVKAYDTFRSGKDIKQILTESQHFRMIINKDGTAEIAKARGNL